MGLRDVLKWVAEAIEGPKTIPGPAIFYPESSALQMARLVATEISKNSGSYSIGLVTTLRPTGLEFLEAGSNLTAMLCRSNEEPVDFGPIKEADLPAKFADYHAKLEAGQEITRGLALALAK